MLNSCITCRHCVSKQVDNQPLPREYLCHAPQNMGETFDPVYGEIEKYYRLENCTCQRQDLFFILKRCGKKGRWWQPIESQNV